MSGELEYERIRNTYHYQVTSDDGEAGLDSVENFGFIVPPFAYPEHNDSQRAIFTLKGMVVGDQAAGAQIGAIAYLTLEIQGILRPNSYNTAMPDFDLTGMRPSTNYLIPNVYEEFDSITATTNTTATQAVDSAGVTPGLLTTVNGVVTTTPIQRLTGSYDLSNPYKMVCSNPVGTTLIFKVRNDAGNILPAIGAANTIVLFDIELIPNP